MKFSIRLKLFLSYAGIVFATLVIVGWTAQFLLNRHFSRFISLYDFESMPRPLGPDRPGLNLFLETIESSLIYTTVGAGVLAMIVSLLVSVLFTRPIGELIAATKAIATGNYSRRVQVHSDDELGELSHALNTMAASLQENQRLQQDLVTTMVHELATPLTNLTGYLEAMNDGLIQGQKRDATLLLMKEETARLSSMVTEVRELSQLQNPSFQLHRRDTDLPKLIEKVIAQMEPQLTEKSLRVEFIKEALSPLQLDPDRLIQVLQNLLKNAITHSPTKGLITVTLTQKKTRVYLHIQDQGPGIKASDLPHIFERFYRADASRSRKTGGLGIGLAVVKEIIEAHGGRVRAESEAGQGSRFSISF